MIKYRKTNHPKWKWELEDNYICFIHDESVYLPPTYTEYIDIDVHTDYNDERFITIELKKGYAINGVNLLPDLDCWMRAAFVHDSIWQLIQLGKLPKSMARVADRIFKDIVIEDMSVPFKHPTINKLFGWVKRLFASTIATLMWLGVRIGAKWRFGLKY